MCKIFTREKIQGKLAQKLLSIVVSLSLMASMAPGKMAQAAEPTTFVSTAYANHWGRSDLRSYMNGVAKGNGTSPMDTTGHARQTSGYYESRFSDAEFGLVQPFTYKTNVLNSSEEATAVYETSDRFWLPSANHGSGNDQVTSWGAEDISANAQYSKNTAADKARIIPISYWSCGALSNSWLRSPYFNNDDHALEAERGSRANDYNVGNDLALAAACKINLTSVIFASAASAANLVAAGGTQKIEIASSTNFGKKTSSNLPDYGMYLKTASDKTFTANSLSLSSNNLTVGYTGGEAGQYAVIQAFKDDSLTSGTTGYAAAQQLGAGQTSATIDVTSWGISSLGGYTVKVWMEDNTGSLAKATLPTTFVGTSKTESGAVQNGRVFAMKADLQCSWGSLANTTDLVGEGTTNQKIYFGSHNGNPLEFWIAGRETAANGGAIGKDGDIMTLYQAKSVETKQFNASSNNYDVAGKPAVTLQLAENQTALYTGSGASYPAEQITFKQGDADQDKTTLKWLHRAHGTEVWTTGMPTFRGSYELRCYAEGTDNYERTYSAVVNFTTTKDIPTASDFTFIPPENLTYDGEPKEATVAVNPGITGMGEITAVHYYDSDGNLLDNPPTEVGIYTVTIDVADGDPYTAVSGLTDATWSFEIIPAPAEPGTPDDGTNQHPNWGEQEIHGGIAHYVSADGTTSVEISAENTDANGIIWLREESEGTAAWYGIDNSAGTFAAGSRFYVQWLNTTEHPEAFADIDEETRQQVEENRGWLFRIGVIAPDGTRYSTLSNSVDVYVQIGNDWDETDLQGFYIQQGTDENVEVTYVEGWPYPEGSDEFGVMQLNHFSPYFIYDKDTEKEQRALNSAETGDELTYVTISGLGLVMTLALGLIMLNSKMNRKNTINKT